MPITLGFLKVQTRRVMDSDVFTIEISLRRRETRGGDETGFHCYYGFCLFYLVYATTHSHIRVQSDGLLYGRGGGRDSVSSFAP